MVGRGVPRVQITRVRCSPNAVVVGNALQALKLPLLVHAHGDLIFRPHVQVQSRATALGSAATLVPARLQQLRGQSAPAVLATTTQCHNVKELQLLWL